MNVQQIYLEYSIPNNLQEHMLRVAGLSNLLNKDDDLLYACLFHDIAKPMNFDLSKQAQFGMSEEDIVKLAKLQQKIKTEHRKDEHNATVSICKTIGLSNESVRIVSNLEWKYIPQLLEEQDLLSCTAIYCDMRIGPKGILPLEDRLNELKERTDTDDFEESERNGHALEQFLQEQLFIDLDTVTENLLVSQFNHLRNLPV